MALSDDVCHVLHREKSHRRHGLKNTCSKAVRKTELFIIFNFSLVREDTLSDVMEVGFNAPREVPLRF